MQTFIFDRGLNPARRAHPDEEDHLEGGPDAREDGQEAVGRGTRSLGDGGREAAREPVLGPATGPAVGSGGDIQLSHLEKTHRFANTFANLQSTSFWGGEKIEHPRRPDHRLLKDAPIDSSHNKQTNQFATTL